MAFREQLTLTTAPSGAGKTYVRCSRFLVNEFLIYEKGQSWSNFPVNIDAIADHFIEKDKLTDQAAEDKRDEIYDRIKIIPQDELKDWQHGLSGPWDFFADIDLTGAHISIDEAHLYFLTERNNNNVAQWQEWIGAIRHAGATVELVTQTPAKIPTKIQQEAGAEITLIDSQGARDPFFKILMADWYELVAKFRGDYVSYFVEVRKKRYGKKWKVEQTIAHRRNPKYFAFYNSFNEVGKVQGSEAQKHEYEKRGWLSLLRWFYLRNAMTITLRMTAATLVVCFLFLIPKIPLTIIDKLSEHHKNTQLRRERERGVEKKPAPKVINSTYVGTNRAGGPLPVLPGAKTDQEKIIQLEKEYAQITRDFLALRSQYNGLVKTIDQVRSQNDEIGMLFETWAVTRGGRIIKPGDKLLTIDGEKEIKDFDYENSKVNYTDDTSGWVTIGQRRLSVSLPDESLQADAEANQGTPQRGPGAGREKENSRSRVNHLQSNRPTTRVGSVDHRQADESHNRGIPGATTETGHIGSDQSANRPRDNGTQSVPEYRTGQARGSVLSRPTPQ